MAGAPLRFSFRHDEAPPVDGEMLVYEPRSVLEFRWDTDLLRFELQPPGTAEPEAATIGPPEGVTDN